MNSILKSLLIISACALLIFGCTEKESKVAPGPVENVSTLKDVPTSAEDVNPLKVGSQVPKLTLRSADGKPFDLNASIAEKPTILIFYRGGWCPYCNAQLGQIKEIEPKLIEMGYRILAISPDKPEELVKTMTEKELAYKLLSDSKMDAARAFGIAFEVDKLTRIKYKGFGINLEKASNETHHQLPVPSVFIVGMDGVIDFQYSNPDYKVRIDPEKLLEAAKNALM